MDVALKRSYSHLILERYGNGRQKIMLVLMPQAQDNKGSIFFLDSIHSVDDVEEFIEDYHAAKTHIIFMNKRNNESTDQSPTIDEQI